MSGYAFASADNTSPDFLRMTLELGAACCLRKPFTPQALLAAINGCLKSRWCPISRKDRRNKTSALSQRFILAIGLTILLVISGTSILLDESHRDATAADRTVSVLKQIADLKVLVRGAESAARGFALTGDQGLRRRVPSGARGDRPGFRRAAAGDRRTAQRRLIEERGQLAKRRLAISDDLIRIARQTRVPRLTAEKLAAEARSAARPSAPTSTRCRPSSARGWPTSRRNRG